MKIERRDSSDERRIVAALITDNVTLAAVSEKWEPDLFKSKWSNLIGSWCVKYHREYDKAPGRHIESLFKAWANKAKDEKTVNLIETYLGSLSDEYGAKDHNSQYLIDLAAKHFNRVKLIRLNEQLEAHLAANELEDANEIVEKFSKVQMGESAGIDVLSDKEAIREAFENQDEVLIEYPGPLGKFFGSSLCRDGFISFEAPDKRGKTWWMLDIAWQGMLQRRKVAFFAVGDMSQRQMLRRFMVRAARHPLHPRTVQVPVSVTKEGEVDFDEETFEKHLSWKAALKKCEKITRTNLRSKETMLKMACYPAKTISVRGVNSTLDTWEREGWIPDVVVIDYADLLETMPGVTDPRETHNATWIALAALRQQRHCLVVTATQANAASYKAHTLGREHFGNDKRKNAHVTGMIGINATSEEEERGVQRLNWIVLREAEYHSKRCAYVAPCFALGRPAMKAAF